MFDEAASARCAEKFLGALSQEFPRVKKYIDNRNYQEAHDSLKFIDFENHYNLAQHTL